MPQWAGSCWYYLRYLDPKNTQSFCAQAKEKYWMGGGGSQPSSAGVDLYVGGAEHAVLHLLYSRFWHKVLFDLGHVSTPEPFMRLVNQGMILGEDGQKMSKSKGNVINPDDVVSDYGADAFRLYEMFMGPLEQMKPWSMRGVEGVYRFLGRVWRLFIDEASEREFSDALTLGKASLESLRLSSAITDGQPTTEQLKVLHTTIRAVTNDLESLGFNTAIARMMEFVNEAVSWDSKPRAVLEPFLQLLAPFAPHLCEELWQKLGHSESLSYAPWPTHDEALLVTKTVTIILQVNGKVRDKIVVATGLAEEEVKKLALANEKVQATLAGQTIKKVIVVPNKLVNIAAGESGTFKP
jgi:leucyl-tRNA synthetase